MKYDDAIKLFENCPIACGMTCEALAERTCGYCALQRSAETILDALRMAQGIANPQPLTLEQLRERIGKPVYVKEQYLYALVCYDEKEREQLRYWNGYCELVEVILSNGMHIFGHEPKEG